MGPPPAIAEVRAAVRRCLAEFGAGDLVLAACSGRAREVTGVLTGLGLEPVACLRAAVSTDPGHGGPEAAARTARYAALADAAHRTGAVAVLLAHSRDDQAESVLLGLARGSGPRSLAGMAESR